MWHLSFKNHLRMTSVLPFLGYVSKRQHGIALNGICSRFEDTLPLCVCTTPSPNFCLLQRFVLIYLFPPVGVLIFLLAQSLSDSGRFVRHSLSSWRGHVCGSQGTQNQLPAEFSLFCCTFLVGTPWWRTLWEKNVADEKRCSVYA